MNFTTEIKKEIISQIQKSKRKSSKRRSDDRNLCLALISAYLRASAEFGIKDGVPTFFIVTETESVAEFFISTFTEIFSAELTVVATMDRLSGRDKLVLQCPISYSRGILTELGLLTEDGNDFNLGIADVFKTDPNLQSEYIKGVFLSSGSCMIPEEKSRKGYHLEFVFSEQQTAEEFCELLLEKELLAKIIARKETFIVYIKHKEIISDFLSIIETEHCLRRFSELVEKRDEANQSNRAANCFAGNFEKTVNASVKQVMAIEKLKNSSCFQDLADELKDLALFRLENPAMSLQEIADSLKIGKSCLNHRMRRLVQLAEKLEGTEEK